MKIDIICPLYNAEKHIEKLDKNIKKQKNVDINQIRYILTKGEDNTQEILNQLKATYKIIEPQEFSHSLTREKEAFASNADILVFITQDIIIEDELWLYYLVKDIESGTCDASFSNQICKNNSIEKYTRELNYPETSYYVTKDDIDRLQLKTFFFSDASSAIKKDTFVKLNGYDGKDLPISEDMYIAYKLIMNGYTIKYCADSKVIHSHDFTYKQLYDRYYITGKFFKQNSYLEQYKVTNSGFGMAKYVLKRAFQEKNIKVLIQFIPNMLSRFIGMKMGKRKGDNN